MLLEKAREVDIVTNVKKHFYIYMDRKGLERYGPITGRLD